MKRKNKKWDRLEEDGTYLEEKEHYESWKTKIYVGKDNYTAYIRVPMSIVRHLGLKNKDRIIVAIKRE